ncbi:MAG: molybdopterin-dependent oxidoreductase [Ornithinimicrobium sp.]
MGLLLLVFLVLGVVSGSVIWWQLTIGDGASIVLISVHSYVGLLGLPVLLAKISSGVAAWRHRNRAPRPAASHRRLTNLMTAALILVILAQYASGVAMYLNGTAISGGLLKTVHLWSALVGTPVVSYHVWRFLRRARATVRTTVASADQSGLTAGRRHIITAGALGLVTWGTVRVAEGSASALSQRGPNDFPVTLTSGGADQPDPAEWRMRVDGQVQRRLVVSLADLRAGPVERHTYSLDCVLGWSATRTWGGVPLSYFLQEAGASADLVSVVVHSTTGYQVALLRSQCEDPRTMVVWEVDGVDLTSEHGFPARIMAPDVIGERCLKWVDHVTVIAA